MTPKSNTSPAYLGTAGFRFTGTDGKVYVRHSADAFICYPDDAAADQKDFGGGVVIKSTEVVKFYNGHPIPDLATPDLWLPHMREQLRREVDERAAQARQREKERTRLTITPASEGQSTQQSQPQDQRYQHSTPLTAEEPIVDEPAIVALLRAARINPLDDLPEPTPCLTVELNDQVSTIGTTGNFSVLIGAAKSRKSFAVCIAVAAALNAQQLVIGCIRGHLPANKSGVIYFDTEQGRYHVAKSVRRVCQLSGIEHPQHLRTFALRLLDTLQRLESIRYAIEHTPGIGLVVIDGIRDIVYDINSPEEATNTASLLLRMTEQYGIHLLTVLHTNKGNGEARGHLGTELINKAETVIRITKDPNDKSVSIVAPEMCRDRDFEPFAFSINEQGLPVLADDWQPTTPKNSQRRPGATSQETEKPKPKELTNEQLTLVLKRAFEGDPQTYDPTWRNLIAAAEHHGIPVPSQSQAKQLLTSLVQRNFVETVKGRYTQYRSTGNYPSE